MRILWLIQSYEVHAFEVLAEALGRHMDVELVRLTSDEQRRLATTFSRFDFSAYDRVMTTLRSKKEMRQWRTMKKIPNLVIFEYDACQNYLTTSKYKGKFSRYYRRLGGPKLIVSGAEVATKLTNEHFDAHFLPKGYNPRIIQAGREKRDIPLAFIGRVDHPVYSERKKMVQYCQEHHGLQILRTQSAEEYAKALNRIQLFLSADIGLGEYMAKNFEAMAAGCVLVTYSQGKLENQALGFVDMENVVLYQTVDELEEKINQLFSSSELMEKISTAGAQLARKSFSYDAMGERLAAILQLPLRPRNMKSTWRDKLSLT
ncbi:MAG: glycosyltransferase [Desulfuromonadaceae bacterium]|nr:glycosyltransferase [Desulfuromonadaceae bacterium]